MFKWKVQSEFGNLLAEWKENLKGKFPKISWNLIKLKSGNF